MQSIIKTNKTSGQSSLTSLNKKSFTHNKIIAQWEINFNDKLSCGNLILFQVLYKWTLVNPPSSSSKSADFALVSRFPTWFVTCEHNISKNQVKETWQLEARRGWRWDSRRHGDWWYAMVQWRWRDCDEKKIC